MVAMADEWGGGSPPLRRQRAAQSSVAAMSTTELTAQQSTSFLNCSGTTQVFRSIHLRGLPAIAAAGSLNRPL
jgi:hypothetical protein